MNLFALVLSISGFVPAHATILRTVVMSVTFFFSVHLVNSNSLAPSFSLLFFLLSTAAYIGFLYLVLPQHGLRHWFSKHFGGKEQGYLAYEAVVAFLFFITGTAIGYVSVSYKHTLSLPVSTDVVRIAALLFFVVGWVIKIWAAHVVGVGIYYWKDMFYGKKIGGFVARGPYKYINNPMYGLGQMQAYATALWYFSLHGLVAAFLYQAAVYSFYFLQEKKFIQKIYLQKTYQQAA